jgi:hypothetical protein
VSSVEWLCLFIAVVQHAFRPLIEHYSFRAESTCSILLRLQCTTTHRAVPGRHAMIYRVGKDLIESNGFAQPGIP